MVISAYYSQMGPSKCGDCGQELDWREEHRCGSSRPERDRRDPFESSPNDFDFPQQPSYLPIQPSHKCGGCNHIITDLSEAFEIEVLNKWYHADCFVCCQCSVAFDDHEPYVPFNGNAYCERDFEMMHVQSSSTEICAACKKPIEETPKYAFGRAFHERHLRVFLID
jgi:hypothetical protein